MSNQTHLDWSFYRSKYKRKTESDKVEMIWNTAEAVVRGHPWDAKKVSVTGAGSLRECQNTDFVWSWEKWCFGKVAISRAFRLRECRLEELPLYVVDERTTDATFTIIICINMSTVSSDAGIQECHWQRLSWLDESIYMYELTITHPNHGVGDVWYSLLLITYQPDKVSF